MRRLCGNRCHWSSRSGARRSCAHEKRGSGRGARQAAEAVRQRQSTSQAASSGSGSRGAAGAPAHDHREQRATRRRPWRARSAGASRHLRTVHPRGNGRAVTGQADSRSRSSWLARVPVPLKKSFPASVDHFPSLVRTMRSRSVRRFTRNLTIDLSFHCPGSTRKSDFFAFHFLSVIQSHGQSLIR